MNVGHSTPTSTSKSLWLISTLNAWKALWSSAFDLAYSEPSKHPISKELTENQKLLSREAKWISQERHVQPRNQERRIGAQSTCLSEIRQDVIQSFGIKWPSLTELYQKLKHLDNGHQHHIFWHGGCCFETRSHYIVLLGLDLVM